MVQCRRRRAARRVAFSPFATAVLVTAFSISSTPTKEQRQKLAEAIGTTERRVQVWFQNRRQRAQPSDGSAPPAIGTTAVPLSADAVALHEQEDEPYPIGADDEEEDEDDDDVATAAPEAAVTVETRPKEGLLKDNMKMEAFTTLFPPFEMMWASGDWLDFCGFQTNEIVGKTLKCIQGPETDADTIVTLMDAVARVTSITVRLTNYTRHGIPFAHDVEVQPLTNSRGEPVLYKVRSNNIIVHPGPSKPLACHQLGLGGVAAAAASLQGVVTHHSGHLLKHSGNQLDEEAPAETVKLTTC